MVYLRFIVAMCWQGVIPWIVAALIKRPMAEKGYKVLSAIFAIIPLGSTYEALRSAGVSSLVSDLFPIAISVALYLLIKKVGIAILKKRGKLIVAS